MLSSVGPGTSGGGSEAAGLHRAMQSSLKPWMKPGSIWVHGHGDTDILERAKESILARGGVVLSASVDDGAEEKPAQAVPGKKDGVQTDEREKSRKADDAQDVLFRL